jgi:type II secretory pathway pseudopilin PulG
MRAVAIRRGEEGYNLVILMVLVTVMNVAVAVTLPSWSKWAQREKEEELIFRGLQYAEAIRVFQTRHGRPPNTLEELIEVEPRSIRQLYPNPMTENGKWGLLVQAQPGTGGGQGGPAPGGNSRGQRGQRQQGQGQVIEPVPTTDGSGGAGIRGQTGQGGRPALVPIPPSQEEEGFGRGPQRTTGAIFGVFAGVEGEAMKVFFGQSSYNAWLFTADLLPMPVMVGGEAPAPRVTAAWVGKPFREDLQPAGGNVPGQAGAPGRDLTAPTARGAGGPNERAPRAEDRRRRRP